MTTFALIFSAALFALFALVPFVAFSATLRAAERQHGRETTRLAAVNEYEPGTLSPVALAA